MEYEEGDVPIFKVIVLGDSSVGKTSILATLSGKPFDPNTKATIGGSFVESVLNTSLGQIKLQIWDTAGQEQYRCLVPIYARSATAAVIVFDISKPQTFDSADNWLEILNNNKTNECAIFAVTNKMDLEPKLDSKLVEKWAFMNKAYFAQTSAKDFNSVQNLFIAVAERSYKTPIQVTAPSIKSLDSTNTKKEKNCC